MKTGNLVRFMSLVVVILFLLFCQVAFSMESQINVLGDVIGEGRADMKAAFNNWIPVTGKTYPIVSQTQLKTGDGKMSIMLRDGVRMEIAKNSDLTISGSKGNYTVSLDNGSIGFSVPQGIDFSVVTRTSTVQVPSAAAFIKKVSLETPENVRGIVIYDGKGTKVISVSGTLMVKNALGERSQMVTAGKAFYVAGTDAGYRVTPVQLIEDQPAGVISPWPFILGGAKIGEYFLVNSFYHASHHTP